MWLPYMYLDSNSGCYKWQMGCLVVTCVKSGYEWDSKLDVILPEVWYEWDSIEYYSSWSLGTVRFKVECFSYLIAKFVTDACSNFLFVRHEENQSLYHSKRWDGNIHSFDHILFVWMNFFFFLPVHCDRRCACWCSSCKSCGNEVCIRCFILL